MQMTAKLAASTSVLLLVLLAVTGASAQSFQAQNVLVTDLVGSAGRSYSASSLQYWAASGQEAILYTVPYSATSSFTILEDFASGLRYVACADGCQVESLSGVSFPQLSAATLSSTSWDYGSFQRTFALPSGSSAQTLGTRPTVPALCATSSSLALSSDPCLPYGLPCGSSCLCLGCTDGDTCTANDACAVSSLGILTCTGLETCNRTTSGARTAIVLRHRGGGGGSGTAVALGVALGVGIGVPAAILLLFLLCVLPLILLPLLWRRRERRPTVVRTTAAPVAGAPYAAAVPAAAAAGYAPATYMAGPGGTPVAIGNPLYAEPWRTAAVPQGLAGASGAAGSTAQAVGRTGEAVARDIPVYP